MPGLIPSIVEQGGIHPWPKPAEGQLEPRKGAKSVGLQGYSRKEVPVVELDPGPDD